MSRTAADFVSKPLSRWYSINKAYSEPVSRTRSFQVRAIRARRSSAASNARPVMNFWARVLHWPTNPSMGCDMKDGKYHLSSDRVSKIYCSFPVIQQLQVHPSSLDLRDSRNCSFSSQERSSERRRGSHRLRPAELDWQPVSLTVHPRNHRGRSRSP